MKKRSYLIATILLSAAALSLSSCLKDNRYVDFSKAGNIVDFPKGGASFFGADAITEAPDTDANGTIVRQFAVNVATANVPTTATTLTLAIDNSIITKYNATSPVQYEAMPAAAFIFTATTVTIPAGKQYATVSVTFNKNLLDPAKSYMLPIKIASTTGGYTISGNMGIHYYHFIGNDFAGPYRAKYQRFNAADSVSGPPTSASFDFSAGNVITFLPVTPTEFTVYSGYVAQGEFRYDVTFTKNSDGTYSNFHVQFVQSDVDGQAPAITVGTPPVFFDPVLHKPATADLAGPYTFAEAQKIFHFQWEPVTTAPRYILDTYLK